MLKSQGVLFTDGSDRHHHAVVTNLDWDAVRLLQWHREGAGTVEHVHDELKNGLAAGHMPSQRFAVNAAWLKLAIMTYNIASAIKGLCLSPEERTAFKKCRLLLVAVAGRMSRRNCVMRIRLCASEQIIVHTHTIRSSPAPSRTPSINSAAHPESTRRNEGDCERRSEEDRESPIPYDSIHRDRA